MEQKQFKLSDEVLHRFVQIIQEGMITMTDVTDGMRMVRIVPSEDDPSTLVLTADYKRLVEKQHEVMVEEGKALLRNSRGEPSGGQA